MNFNFDTLARIAKNFGQTLQDKTEEGGGKCYEIDGMYMSETDEPVLCRGIVDRPHPTKVKWVVEGTKYYPATRYEPEEQDIYEIEKFDDPCAALGFILSEWYKIQVTAAFEAEAEAEFEHNLETETYA